MKQRLLVRFILTLGLLAPAGLSATPSSSANGAVGRGSGLADSLARYLETQGWIASAPVDEEEEKGELLNLNFQNQDIAQVLKFISEQTGKTIMKSDEVNGRFTIICPTKITKERALDLILTDFEMKGITWIETEDLIQVIPLKSAGSEVVDIEAGFDVPADSRMRTRILTLEHSDPTKIQEAIKPLLPETASIIPNDRTKTLMITATGTDLTRISKIIASLDIPDRTGADEYRIFRIKHTKADALVPTVSTLLGHLRGEASEPSRRRPSRSAGDTQIIADGWSNSILAAGPTEDLDLVANLIDQLDTAATSDFETEIFRLKHAEAQSVSDAVENLLSIHKTGFADPKVVANEWTNALIVSCLPEDMASVEGLIKEMDMVKEQDRSTRIFRLENADASNVHQVLSQLFRNRGTAGQSYYDYRTRSYRQQKSTGEAIDIMADERLNALIISAADSDFPEVERLIAELDQPTEEGSEEPRFYQLKSSSAEQVAETINNLFTDSSSYRNRYSYYGGYYQPSGGSQLGGFSGRVRVIAETITNSVVVIASTPKAFEPIEKLISQLDAAVPDSGSTKIIRLENANAVEVSAVLNELFAEDEESHRGFFSYYGREDGEQSPFSNLVGKVRIVPDRRTNSLLISTSAQNLGPIEEIIGRLDEEVAQVLIEVLIVEVLLSDSDQLGIDWNDGRTSIVSTGGFSDESEAPTGFFPNRFDRLSFLSTAEFEVVLNHLATESLLNVMSRPDIITTNNRKASLNNSVRYPIVDTIATTNTGTSSSVNYEEVGLILDVTPSVSMESGLVVLDVSLKNGAILETQTVRIGDTLYSQFSNRSVRTNIRVEGGKTVVIGGVISENQSSLEKRVPLLGKIPIMGRLFRSNRDTHNKSELITFITPYVIRNPDDMERISRMRRDRINAFEMLESDSIKGELDSFMEYDGASPPPEESPDHSEGAVEKEEASS